MADTLVKKPKLIVGTKAQVEAEMGDNDIGFATDIEFYTARQIDELLSKAGGASLPILTPIWSDHIINDMSWLCADTFSWQPGDDTYKAAYEHLVGDLERAVPLYCWKGSNGTLYYSYIEDPGVGDSFTDGTKIIGRGTSGINISGDIVVRYSAGDTIVTQTDTIGDITISYYLAQDGHKICLPDQESYVTALYEATGVAWYYILDIVNKQFKLPRTKYGFTGLRDSVGGYVPESLPNIKGTFLNGHYTVQGSGAFYDAGAGGTKEYANVADDRKVGFDASRSSSAYKDGAPVQQRATQMYLYFYVGNFERDAIEQTAGLNAEMFNDLNAHKVVETQIPTSDNGYTWYRKYADGWVEQGGIVTVNKQNANGAVTVTVNLPVEMANANYYVAPLTFITDGGNTTGLRNHTNTRATTTLKIGTYSTTAVSNNYTGAWEIKGMAA